MDYNIFVFVTIQDGFETLNLRLHQLDRLIEENVPDLWNHMREFGIKADMFASQWFLTLFGSKFSPVLVFRILDVSSTKEWAPSSK